MTSLPPQHDMPPDHPSPFPVPNNIHSSSSLQRFDAWMNTALYHPQTGYYSRGQDIFGGDGDFYTAPEISPWFGEQLASWLEPFLAATGGIIWEFGAGRGKLASAILQALGPKVQQYHIIELSGELRANQQQALHTCTQASGHFAEQLHWHDTLPDSLPGIVLANEVLDAIPVRVWRFHHQANHPVQELWVEEIGGKVQSSWHDADEMLTTTVLQLHQQYGPWPDGYTSEWPEQAMAWLQTITSRMRGMAVTFDYGFNSAEYFHPQRSMGTLMAHHRQRSSSDIFANPGQQDITAHVNFSLACDAIMDENAELLGFTTQAKFLLAQQSRSSLPAQESKAFFQRSRDIQLLTHESEMGELFKCMVWQHGWDAYEHAGCVSQLERLALIDQSYRL